MANQETMQRSFIKQHTRLQPDTSHQHTSGRLNLVTTAIKGRDKSAYPTICLRGHNKVPASIGQHACCCGLMGVKPPIAQSRSIH